MPSSAACAGFFCVHTGLANHYVFKVLSICIFALLLSSRSGSNDGSSNVRAEKGELIVGFTDAEGDLVSYIVDVTSITLTKANGAIVTGTRYTGGRRQWLV